MNHKTFLQQTFEIPYNFSIYLDHLETFAYLILISSESLLNTDMITFFWFYNKKILIKKGITFIINRKIE